MADASSGEGRSFWARFSSYRPVFDRILFGVALLGVFVAVHLLIQQGRGFDRGCLGFSSPAAVESTFDCNLVTESRAGTLLGLSNAWWGIGFYLAVAGLSAAAAFGRRRFSAATTRAVLIGGGVLYSGYLTYHQFAGLGALCALCLTSAALALALFIVQAAMLARFSRSGTPSSSSKNTAPMTASSDRSRPALWGAAVLALLVLVGADLAYFSSLENGADEPAVATAASETNEAPARRTAQPEAPAAAPVRSDTTETEGLPPGCQFSADKEPVETSRMVGFTDPVFGAADAPVTLVEFFDPNCPHCKTFHATMERLMDQYGDRARFVFKPIPLWRRSINQIAALHAAGQQGKFQEMLAAQFARQQQSGLTDDQLAGIAREVGMNPDAMLAQIRQNSYQQQIMRDRELAQEAGVSGTPAVSINGQLVARRARTPQCVTALLEREVEQADS